MTCDRCDRKRESYHDHMTAPASEVSRKVSSAKTTTSTTHHSPTSLSPRVNRDIVDDDVHRKMDSEKKDITNEDIFKCLMKMRQDVSEDIINAKEETNRVINEKLGMVDENMTAMKTEIATIAKIVGDNEVNQDERMNRMEVRMKLFEKEVEKSKDLRNNAQALKEAVNSLQDQPLRKHKPRNQPPISKSPTATEENDKSPVETPEDLMTTSGSFKSSWAKQLSNELAKDATGKDKATVRKDNVKDNTNEEHPKDLEHGRMLSENVAGEKDSCNKVAGWLENQTRQKHLGHVPEPVKHKNKVKGMKALKRWFGDETEESEDTDDSDDSEWGKVDRIRKNKLKCKAAAKRKELRRRQTFTKAQHILGLGPVKCEDIEKHMTGPKEFEAAKVTAIKHFLGEYLSFDRQELKDLTILETFISAKKDDIIYVAFQNIEDIREIYLRIAESGDPDIRTRDYIPPQVYDRYMAISKHCKDVRSENPSIKTQIRFGDTDLEVLTKVRGAEEPFKITALEKLMDVTLLPEYDHSRKWLPRIERPPRRKVLYTRQVQQSNTWAVSRTQQEFSRTKHPISRQSSTEDRGKRIRSDNAAETDREEDDSSDSKQSDKEHSDTEQMEEAAEDDDDESI